MCGKGDAIWDIEIGEGINSYLKWLHKLRWAQYFLLWWKSQLPTLQTLDRVIVCAIEQDTSCVITRVTEEHINDDGPFLKMEWQSIRPHTNMWCSIYYLSQAEESLMAGDKADSYDNDKYSHILLLRRQCRSTHRNSSYTLYLQSTLWELEGILPKMRKMLESSFMRMDLHSFRKLKNKCELLGRPCQSHIAADQWVGEGLL